MPLLYRLPQKAKWKTKLLQVENNSMDQIHLLDALKSVAYLEGEFVTRAGKATNYYIDKYRFETQPDILLSIARHLSTLLPPSHEFDCIAAPELGAVSIAAVLSVTVGKPFVIVRKQSKEYGTQRMIEGVYSKGQRMVIVEDILTTGGAALKAFEILKSEGVVVSHIIGVINREEGAFENIKNAGVEPVALFNRTQLLASSSR